MQRVTLTLSCSFLVTPCFLQARVLENVEKPIYHSQPEVIEGAHCRLSQSSWAVCCSLLLQFEYSPQHSTESTTPHWLVFLSVLQQLRCPPEEVTGSSGPLKRSDNNWNQWNELLLLLCYWPEALQKEQREKLVPRLGPQSGPPRRLTLRKGSGASEGHFFFLLTFLLPQGQTFLVVTPSPFSSVGGWYCAAKYMGPPTFFHMPLAPH